MRCSRTNLLSLGLLLLVACDDGSLTGSVHDELHAAEPHDAGGPVQDRGADNSVRDAGARGEGDQGVRPLGDGGAPINLMCPQGGNTAPIAVVFGCDRITVITCKDLSNVVLELADGSRQRLQGLKGHQNVFVSTSGQPVVGVWVKAGQNLSGDGPGYGERFNAPTAACTDGGTTPPQNPPTQAPPNDACVTGPDMPCFTTPGQPPSPPPQNQPPSEPPTEGPGWVD